jgi:hypothetical protein
MRIAALALLVAAAIAPAWAEVPADYKMKCPVGGETFTYKGYAAHSTYGARFDGKPYGSTSFPLRLPVCPRNGFIVLKDEGDYTPTEIATYTAIVARDAFRKLTAGETTYYRAWFMQHEAGIGPDETAWLLLQATWEADAEPARHLRYQREFIQFVDASAAKLPRDKIDWWYLQYYAANAERQIGAFDAAAKRLAALRAANPPEDIDGDKDWGRDELLKRVARIETLAKARDTRLDDPQSN